MIAPLSTTPAPADFAFVPIQREPLEDFEIGGVAIGDTSAGGMLRLWRTRYDYLTGTVFISADAAPGLPAVPESVAFSYPGITEIALAFDQLMSPVFLFLAGGTLYYRWYDPLASDYVIVSIGPGRTPRATLDDPRNIATASDVTFAYVRPDNVMCARFQGEGYAIEHELLNDVAAIHQIGFSLGNRLQFFYAPA